MVIDNTSLNRIAIESLRLDDPDFQQINKAISSAMSSFTSPIRFPTHSYTNFISIMAGLVPIHDLHFLFSSYTPYGLQNYVICLKISNSLFKQIYKFL